MSSSIPPSIEVRPPPHDDVADRLKLGEDNTTPEGESQEAWRIFLDVAMAIYRAELESVRRRSNTMRPLDLFKWLWARLNQGALDRPPRSAVAVAMGVEAAIREMAIPAPTELSDNQQLAMTYTLMYRTAALHEAYVLALVECIPDVRKTMKWTPLRFLMETGLPLVYHVYTTRRVRPEFSPTAIERLDALVDAALNGITAPDHAILSRVIGAYRKGQFDRNAILGKDTDRWRQLLQQFSDPTTS